MNVKSGFQAAFRSAIAKRMKTANLAINTANAETAIRIVSESPIRSGKFRSNWNPSLNSPDLSTSESTSYSLDAIKSVAMSATLKDIFYLSDGLPYSHRLEFEGWSNQAPNGMVRINLKQYKSVLTASLAKVGGK